MLGVNASEPTETEFSKLPKLVKELVQMPDTPENTASAVDLRAKIAIEHAKATSEVVRKALENLDDRLVRAFPHSA
jgi:hypothetical protein